MQNKYLIALMLIPVAIFFATAVLSFSRHARQWAFFFLVAGISVSTELDINFLSHEWYRGTTRGIEFSFVDVLAISLVLSSILFPLPGHRRFYWPASLGFILVYFFYCCLSVAFAEPKILGVFELSKVFRALLCFLAGALYVQSERELRVCIWGLAFAVAFQGLYAFEQRYGEGMYRVCGTLEHSNSLSMYLLLTTPVMVAAFNSDLPKLLRWFCAGTACCATVGIVLTASRMGIPAFGLVMLMSTIACISWKITLRKVAVTVLITVAVSAMLIKAWDTITNRFEGGGDLKSEYKDGKEENRGHYLRLGLAIVNDKFWGVGLNNWSYWTSKKYYRELGIKHYMDYEDIPKSLLNSQEVFDWSGKFAAPAHNLAALTAGELGIPGLLLFAFLWARWFWIAGSFLWPRTSDPMRRICVGIFFAMCGVFFQSITEWVFRQTAVMLTFYLLMGVTARLYQLKAREKRAQRMSYSDRYQPAWRGAAVHARGM